MRRVRIIAPDGCAESNFGQDSIVLSEKLSGAANGGVKLRRRLLRRLYKGLT